MFRPVEIGAHCDPRGTRQNHNVEERHRRLVARLLLALGLSLVVFVVGTALNWLLESGHQGGDIHGLGDAAFYA